MPAAGTPRRRISAASSKDRTWDRLHDPETTQLMETIAGAGTDPRISKRSAVVKNALRQRANSCGSAPAGHAGASGWQPGQQQTYIAEQMSAGCGPEALVSEIPGFCASHANEMESSGSSQSEYWYTTLPGLPRRPKTGGIPGTRLESRLYAVAHSKQRATAGLLRTANSLRTERQQHRQQAASAMVTASAAGAAGRLEPPTAATTGVHGSSAVPLQSIVGEEQSSADNTRQSTPHSLRAAIQSGQCTLECDMSETVKSDLTPATLLRKYNRDKGLHYGQIKLALSRNQILEGAAIRDPGGEEARAHALDRSHSLRLNGLRGSMPNIAFASDGVASLQFPIASVKSQLKGPLLVSGILHTGDEPTGHASGAGKGRGGPKGASLEEPQQPAAPAPAGGPSVTQDFVSWQQVLGPQRIPTVTKPPTISTHASAGAGLSATSISLPQRRHQTKLAGGSLCGYSSGGGGSANGCNGATKTSRRPDTGSNRQEAEPRYADPFAGAPASVQTRLAELASLEADTVRWERAGGKTKKKGRERED